MNRQTSSHGFSLIEILVTLVIIMLGLLGLLGVQMRSHQAEMESYQRSQALLLMSDIVQRINANRKAARCYAVTDAASGAPYLGAGNSAAAACTAWGTTALQTRAVADLTAWDELLKGSAETDAAGASIGAMIGARGCVSYDAANDAYRVSVAWQGLVATVDPTDVDATLTCGKDLYGTETRRRIVSTAVRIGDLR
jgi:type IV pilus assembly protein PilV